MQINITVRNQSIIDICPCVVLAEDSQNYVTAVFTFLTDDWDNTEKTAQFQNPKTGEVYESILDSSNACTVRWEALSDSGDMNVAVFGVNGGYRVTTNMGVITVLPTLSGGESDTPPSPDVYQQLLTMLGQKADNMTYSDSVLRLLSGSKELARVIIAGDGSSVQPDWNQNDSGAADYIKNRPFYDDTNVLVEWDGNTEGLVAATGMGDYVGIPAGTIVGYKIAEYISPLTLPGATTFLFEDGFTIPLPSDDPFAYVGDENVDIETYIFSEGKKEYGWIAFIKNDNVESNYASVYYSESGVYWLFGKETEAIKLSQIYMDVNKLSNKYLNVDIYLDKESKNPVQNKAIAAMKDKLPVVVTSNGRYLASATADYVAEMIEKGVLVAGIPNGYNMLTFPEVHSNGGENKVYFFPPYISPDMLDDTGRLLVGNELASLDVNPYTRLVPPPLSQNIGKILTVGTGDKGEAIFSWESLPPVAADDLFIVSISLSQSATFSASYEEITSAISAGKVVIGVVNDATSASIKLASSYWDTQEERVYFYSFDGFSGWKSVYVGASSRGYDVTRYQSDVPTLTVDGLETNARSVIIVSSTGGSYQLKKLTAEDVNALAKDNTTEYTPTGDYNPATKKYVDDAVGDVSAATPRQQMTAEDTTVALQPNTLYVFPEMATLSVTLATPANTNIVNEYHFFFDSGATPTVFSLAAADGSTIYSDAYSIDANMRYEVSVLDNVAYIKGVSMSEA